ncbi:hypothetical protein BGX28_006178 [Mortierella sp. GBA30]|nr:hypothetical protein BGX28_006178 [Mortierella sp. GBA30]
MSFIYNFFAGNNSSATEKENAAALKDMINNHKAALKVEYKQYEADYKQAVKDAEEEYKHAKEQAKERLLLDTLNAVRREVDVITSSDEFANSDAKSKSKVEGFRTWVEAAALKHVRPEMAAEKTNSQSSPSLTFTRSLTNKTENRCNEESTAKHKYHKHRKHHKRHKHTQATAFQDHSTKPRVPSSHMSFIYNFFVRDNASAAEKENAAALKDMISNHKAAFKIEYEQYEAEYNQAVKDADEECKRVKAKAKEHMLLNTLNAVRREVDIITTTDEFENSDAKSKAKVEGFRSWVEAEIMKQLEDVQVEDTFPAENETVCVSA